MKKIFKDTPRLQCKAGEFNFSFYYKEGKLKRCFLRIGDEDSTISFRISGNTDVYGYLLTAAMQGNYGPLQDYATLIYISAAAMTQDQRLMGDIAEAVSAWMERRQAEGAEEAAKVTDTEEQSAQVFMEDVAEYADARTDNEREALRDKWKQELKEEMCDGEDKDA